MSVREATSDELGRSAMIFFDHADDLDRLAFPGFTSGDGVLASSRLTFHSGSTKRLPIRLVDVLKAAAKALRSSSCPSLSSR